MYTRTPIFSSFFIMQNLDKQLLILYMYIYWRRHVYTCMWLLYYQYVSILAMLVQLRITRRVLLVCLSPSCLLNAVCTQLCLRMIIPCMVLSQLIKHCCTYCPFTFESRAIVMHCHFSHLLVVLLVVQLYINCSQYGHMTAESNLESYKFSVN